MSFLGCGGGGSVGLCCDGGVGVCCVQHGCNMVGLQRPRQAAAVPAPHGVHRVLSTVLAIVRRSPAPPTSIVLALCPLPCSLCSSWPDQGLWTCGL